MCKVSAAYSCKPTSGTSAGMHAPSPHFPMKMGKGMGMGMGMDMGMRMRVGVGMGMGMGKVKGKRLMHGHGHVRARRKAECCNGFSRFRNMTTGRRPLPHT